MAEGHTRAPLGDEELMLIPTPGALRWPSNVLLTPNGNEPPMAHAEAG